MILRLELSIASGRMVEDENFEWQARRSSGSFKQNVRSTIVKELTDDKTENAKPKEPTTATGTPNSLKIEPTPPSRLSPASGSTGKLGPMSARFSTLSNDPELQAYLVNSK